MPQFFAGTSGWAYPTWKPDFYPAKLAQKKFLNHYATQLNTVEVNFTFRQLVKETTIQNWLNDTPAHFRFGIKAHQVITHIKRLKGAEDFMPRFLATIEPLAPFHAATRGWFTHSFEAPTAPQSLGWPAIRPARFKSLSNG